MAPKGVGVSFTRLHTDDYTTNETLAKHIDQMADAASRIQPEIKPDVISYCCTSGSIVIGEDKVCAEIKRGAPYATAMTLVSGVVAALNQLQAKKIVIGTPYLDEINIVEKNFFENKGFDVLDIQGLNLGNGIEFGKITPDYIKDFALSIDQKEAEVIFLSCSGIRSLDIIEEVEATTGKPVITSNQAQMWYALRTAGVNDKLSGFGRIFNS
jgi:maleate isomerase